MKLPASGITMYIGHSDDDRAAHNAVYAQSACNLGMSVFSATLPGATVERFGNKADILTACDSDVPVASVLTLYHKETAMPYRGGGTWFARVLRANALIYYALMGHARRRDWARFGFGRQKSGTGAFALLDPKYRLQVQSRQPQLAFANRLRPAIAHGLN